jgi:hypothetical protein
MASLLAFWEDITWKGGFAAPARFACCCLLITNTLGFIATEMKRTHFTTFITLLPHVISLTSRHDSRQIIDHG